jgi:hypothetical protein
MTKHIPRKDRWTKVGPNEHRSAHGRVFFRAGQWRAALVYRVADLETFDPGEVQTWEAGNFKRPRNAMIALEDKVTELQRKHGDRLTFLHSV